MPSQQKLYLSNDMLLKLIGLKDGRDDTFINNAVVSVTVKDSAGANISGQSWPTSMSYVTSSNGDYQAVLSKDLVVVLGTMYFAHITALGNTVNGFWELPVVVETRKFS